jgi:hypothetical protein
MRRVWDAKPFDLDLDLYEKIAQSSFSRLSRLILYGLGEPLAAQVKSQVSCKNRYGVRYLQKK